MAMLQATNQKHIDEKHISFLWLNASIELSQEHIEAKQQLQHISKGFITFTDQTKCEKYVTSHRKKNRLILIVSGSLGHEIVPLIHALKQVVSIYVFCSNKQLHEEWTKNFSKVSSCIINVLSCNRSFKYINEIFS